MQQPRSDQVTVITGATSGIGRVAAGTLARRGGTLILVGRDPERGRDTVEQILRDSGNRSVSFLCADLSAMAEVQRLAAAIRERHERIDLLINNAGAIFTHRRTTVDGLEMTFALNHLAPFLLANLLVEPLQRAAPSRLITVASEAHRGATMDFDDLQSERRYSGWRAYQRSKLANILFTRAFAERYAGRGILAACLHPGFVATRFGDANGGVFALAFRFAKRLFAESAETGGARIVHLATTADPAAGGYYVKDRLTPPSAAARSDADAARLWDISTALASRWLSPVPG